MKLNKLLEEYRMLTLQLIESMADIEKMESLIEQRKELIDTIKSIEYDKNQFKKLAAEFNLIELEENLVNKMKIQKLDAKRALDNVQKLKKARTMYDKPEGSSVYFNMTSY